MTLTGAMTVADLVRLHPWAAEVLEAHGLLGSDVHPTLTLDGLCWLHRVEPDVLLRELDSARVWRERALVTAPDERWDPCPLGR